MRIQIHVLHARRVLLPVEQPVCRIQMHVKIYLGRIVIPIFRSARNVLVTTDFPGTGMDVLQEALVRQENVLLEINAGQILAGM